VQFRNESADTLEANPCRRESAADPPTARAGKATIGLAAPTKDPACKAAASVDVPVAEAAGQRRRKKAA
jgi:hypothetical protein